MPVSYEPINVNTDVTTTKTILHEVIPLTGTIISGTYGVFPNEENIKNFTHGMFQSVYDYPYLSSSANHIFDITVGYDESSPLSGTAGKTMQSKKINMYNQFSQVLLGYTGSANTVRLFESDLLLDGVGQMPDVAIISFARLLTKDQIKQGTFNIEFGVGPWSSGTMNDTITLQDLRASPTDEGTVNSVGGDYGVLYDSTASVGDASANTSSYGVVFYQAGIAVISGSLWNTYITGAHVFNSASVLSESNPTGQSWQESLVSSSISGTCDALRHRIKNITFNNSTEINSTIYFCRLPVNKFN